MERAIQMRACLQTSHVRAHRRILIREQTTDAISFLSLLSQLGRKRGGRTRRSMRRVRCRLRYGTMEVG